jgi:hypothetical protein
MNFMSNRLCIATFMALALSLLGAAQTREQPPASQVTPDRWPKLIEEKGTRYAVYQPQVDSWDGHNYRAHTAVSVLAPGSKDPVFGALEISAVTIVDKQAKLVEFYAIDVLQANFPTAPAMAKQYQQEFQVILGSGPSTMSLDRLQASLMIERYEQKARMVPVNNQPPNLIFTQKPAILILVDGDPVWQPVQETLLTRVLNTRASILRDSTGIIYLHVLDGFVQAQDLSGPWTVAQNVPDAVNETTNQLAQQKVVDLLAGPADDKSGNTPSLSAGLPIVLVEATPSELIVTQGEPQWAALPGTDLQYVTNTTGNIFKDPGTKQVYVLVTGRWFSAPAFYGPWQYVTGKSLPGGFFKIPDDSPKENVKASIPGTPQAQEAVISDQVPQMATIVPSKAQFTPRIDGYPQIQSISGTSLNYVFNSPQPMIQTAPTQWYAVQNGVWFAAAVPQGPWAVAASVPPVIYSIPPSSPLFYVTYVRIYSATPDSLVVGYTPGYMGTVVNTDGVVVYGTGYAYTPYVGSSVWYPPPVTYGYGAAVAYTPWTGWAVGFGFGMAFGVGYDSWGWCAAPYWGAMPYAPYAGFAYGAYGGAAAWGAGGWAATTGNVYSHWGSTSAVTRTSGGYNAWTGNAWGSQVGHSYNSVTGAQAVGERGAVQNVYTGNYAAGGRAAGYNPTTGVAAAGSRYTVGNASGGQTTVGRGVVEGPGGETAHVAQVGNNYYASHDGNVYKDSGSGFQQLNSGGGWGNVDRGQAEGLQSQAQARNWGDQRSAASSWGGNWGGGFDHSGGWDRGGFDSSGFDHSGGWGGNRRWGGGGWGGRSFGGGGFRR